MDPGGVVDVSGDPDLERRYRAELDAKPQTWRPILEAARLGAVTLLFSARDIEHNNAVTLKAYLEKRLHSSKRSAA